MQLTEQDAHYELLNALDDFTGTGGEEFVDVDAQRIGLVYATLRGPKDAGTVRVRIRIDQVPE